MLLAGGFSRQQIVEPLPGFGSHVGKLYSIANLEVARHDNAACAHLSIIEELVKEHSEAKHKSPGGDCTKDLEEA